MKTEYVHFEGCPSYITDKGSHACTCEKLWEIEGLERIQAYISTLSEPDLFLWAHYLQDFDPDGEEQDYDVLEEEE